MRAPLVVGLSLGLSLVAPGTHGAEPEAPEPLENPEAQPTLRAPRTPNETTFLHLPRLEEKAEQGILRPVPLVAELPRELASRAARVLVHYRLWGDPDWTTLELRRVGARFEGAIPCREVSTVTGDLKYYIRVHDEAGRVIGTGATRAEPYLVVIRHDTTLAEGQKAPPKCPDPADCPAGLPGCPSARVVAVRCQSDSDCEGGNVCGYRGVCEPPARRTTWLSLGISQDVGVMSTDGACTIPSQENEGYACFRSDGSPYTGTPVHENENLTGGPAGTRVFLGLEQLLYYDTSVSGRVGFLLAGEAPTARGGTALVPFSFALRLSHFFGSDPFASLGLRPYVFVTGGYSMFDVSAQTRIRENPLVTPFQRENDLEQTLSVYRRAGDGFCGLGAGLGWPVSARLAATVDLAAVQTFPFAVFVLTPSAGMSYGF